jgi:predicted nucleotidyltransferase
MNRPTPYPELNAVLTELLQSTQAILSENWVGLYLNGSFALGGFDPDSDVDFIVVTDADVTATQESALQTMHGRIYDLPTPWAQHLEGSYITKNVLKRPDPTHTLLLYLDNTARELIRSDHCNTLVVRWTMREHGLALAGPDPKTLIDPVVSDELSLEATQIMDKWRIEINAEPAMLENRWLQAYAVVTFCRMLYTIQNGTVASKPTAVQWARGALDSRWSGLIERAWADRPNPSLKYRQQADLDDAQSTLEFIQYALKVMDQISN